MKKTKVMLTLVCAVLLVAASVMGTLAYLSDTHSVKNTFTVGKVSLDSEQGSGLDEAKTNEAGKPVDNTNKVVELAEAPRVTGNAYKLQPGHTYTKDPTVHVAADSDDCYLFVKVENGIATIEDATNNIVTQMAAKGWKALGDSYANIWVYVGTAENATAPLAVSKSTDVVVFEQFKVTDTVDNTTLADYANANITVTAYAVQKDGFENSTAVQIWNAAFGTSANA